MEMDRWAVVWVRGCRGPIVPGRLTEASWALKDL